MMDVERSTGRWQDRWMTWQLGMMAYAVAAYLVATAFDVLPVLFTPASLGVSALVVVGLFVVGAVVGRVLLALWLIRAWSRVAAIQLKNDGDGDVAATFKRCRWMAWVAWLTLVPVVGDLLLMVFLVILGWKRSVWVFLGAIGVAVILRGMGVLFGGVLAPFLCIIPILVSIGRGVGMDMMWGFASIAFIGVMMKFAVLGGVAMIAFYTGLLFLVPRIAGVRWSPSIKKCGWFTLALFVVYIGFSYFAMSHVDRRFMATEKAMRAQGIPRTSDELAELYFEGEPANMEWTQWVDADEGGRSKLRELMRHDARAALHTNATIEAAMAFEEILAEYTDMAQELDEMFSESSVRYGRRFEDNNILPITPVMDAGLFYHTRMLSAVLRHDTQEAMRYYRLGSKVIGSAQQNPFLIGAVVSLAMISQRTTYVARALGKGVLTVEELREIAEDMEKLERSLPDAMRYAVRTEAGYMMGTWDKIQIARSKPEEILFRTPSGAPVYCWLVNGYVSALTFLMNLDRDVRVVGEGGGDMGDLMEHLRQHYSVDIVGSRYLTEPYTYEKGSWHKFGDISARLRMALLACRIEEFRLVEGRLPESLGELGGELPRDPFNGEAFSYQFGEIAVYKNNSHSVPRSKKDLEPVDMIYGYRLWSVGKNRQDDGGKFDDDDVILTVEIVM